MPIGRPRSRIPRVCEICGQGFEAVPSEINRGAARYCSVPCRDEARRRSMPPVESDFPRTTPSIPINCEGCGDTFRVNPHRSTDTRRARFCSVACYRDKGPVQRSQRVEKDCAFCGRPFSYLTSVNPRHHCSRVCRNAAAKLKRSKNVNPLSKKQQRG